MSKRRNVHDVVLSYIAHHDGSSSIDLLTYTWAIQGDQITSRNYLYHVLRRLRKRDLIHTMNRQQPNKARHFITIKGLKIAEPFTEVPNTWEKEEDE